MFSEREDVDIEEAFEEDREVRIVTIERGRILFRTIEILNEPVGYRVGVRMWSLMLWVSY